MQIRDRVKSLRRVKAGELRKNPKNWRTHSAEQSDALAGVLDRVGFADAILARELPGGGLEMIDGHLRADLADDSKVPVLVLDVSAEEADVLLATMDPLAAMAGTDADMLAELIGDLDLGPVQTELEKLVNSGEALGTDELEQDLAPEPPKKPKTRLGDLYTLGKHKLLCGDATDKAAVKQLLSRRKPGLMVTDPPYGVEYEAKWRHDCGLNNSPQIGEVCNDDRASWAAAFCLFPGDVAYVWHAGLYASSVERSLLVCGFELRSQIVWLKRRFAIGRGNYHWRHEPCWYAVRKGAVADWSGGRNQDTAWAAIVDEGVPDELYAVRIDDETIYAFDGAATTVWEIGHDKAAGSGHSTQKPVECMGRPMRNHGGPGDCVYDPFTGSGTSIIAAEQLGRCCLSMEISPAYCDAIVARWEAYTGRKAERKKATK